MFLSHERSPSKMKFQKPNILRKRPKVPAKSNVSQAAGNVVRGSPPLPSALPDWSMDKGTRHKGKPSHFIITPMQRKQEAESRTQIVEDNQGSGYNSAVKSLFSQINSKDDKNEQSSHSRFNFEELQSCNVEVMTLKDYQASAESNLYYQVIIDGEQMILPESCVQIQDACQAPPAATSVATQNNMPLLSEAPRSKAVSAQQAENLSVFKLLPVNSAATFMCDVAGCSKAFPSQQKLKKHKRIHNKTSSPKNPKQVIACPANKLCRESWLGEERRTCGQQFSSRAELVKHLKEEHTLDDAAYKCADCRRAFFWASGVRNHARACKASGRARRLACQWPECGRVFQQPCRLKEHVRAHTGDKPYPCRHPNCTWSFRTASKLLRHVRRHTDERRHPCAHCGRAFLRGEHLRDHARSHHGLPRRGRQPPPPPPPQQTEPNAVNTSLPSPQEQDGFPEEADETSTPSIKEPIISTLSMEESTAQELESDWSDEEDLFLSSAEEMRGGEAEGRAARTHCTWPLPRRPPAPAPDIPDVADVQPDDGVYEVELSEGPDSKIYNLSIRSDLFLHGNVLHNEDSECGVAVIEQTVEESNGATLQGTPLDTELGLLDAHSSIDLMQEELMYTDEAVDGSSFQLLSDGDLQTYYTHVGVNGVRLNSA